MKIGIILGTRPEAIKLIPVYAKLKKNPNFTTRLISTGQHFELINKVMDFFNVTPDFSLKVMREGQSLSELSALIMKRLDDLIMKEKINGVIVQGDTTSAMISSLVAYYHKLKIFHIEAGLRTGNKYSPFPEEINRKTISQVADVHFTPTEYSANNLKNENVIGDIVVSGNTIVDSLLYAKNIINNNLDYYHLRFNDILKKEKKIILVTIHRRENYEYHLDNLFNTIKILAEKHRDLLFVFPRHMNPIIIERSDKYLKSEDNVHLLDSLKYDDFLFLLMKCYLVMSDSGGIQEEAPSFNKPVLIIRDQTERQELVEAGGGILCGTLPESIIKCFEKIVYSENTYTKMSDIENPFGDGKSTERIIAYLNNYLIKSKKI